MKEPKPWEHPKYDVMNLANDDFVLASIAKIYKSEMLLAVAEVERLRAENADLKAKIDELQAEVTYQKQKAQEMVEFICECVAKGEFKAFKNGSVKFGKTKKGEKR